MNHMCKTSVFKTSQGRDGDKDRPIRRVSVAQVQRPEFGSPVLILKTRQNGTWQLPMLRRCDRRAGGLSGYAHIFFLLPKSFFTTSHCNLLTSLFTGRICSLFPITQQPQKMPQFSFEFHTWLQFYKICILEPLIFYHKMFLFKVKIYVIFSW